MYLIENSLKGDWKQWLRILAANKEQFWNSVSEYAKLGQKLHQQVGLGQSSEQT